MQRLLRIDFVRFCIVGAIGFMINFVLLTFLYKYLSFPLLIAQLISGEVALFSNFLLHHKWTYKDKNVLKSLKKILIQFHMTSWVAIIGTALLVAIGVQYLHLNYIVALAVAGLIALFWNFIWSKYIIWRHEQSLTGNKVNA